MENQRKVLILTSYITGHGHASITSAIEDALRAKGIDFKSVEAYEMCSKTWYKRGKNYGKTTRKHPKLWEFYFGLGTYFTGIARRSIERSARKKFLKIYKEYQPDTIVSDHPLFVGSIMNILDKAKLPYRFIPVIADLVSITPLWIDKRSALTICPSREALGYCLRKGLDPEKLKVINLPSRKHITDRAKTITETERKSDGKVRLLIMSGAEGSGDMAARIKELLKVKNSFVTAIAGRNIKLEESLKEEFANNPNVEIHGFVNNIDEVIARNDIAIVRGSPNVLMECVNLMVPVIITDYLGGQEPGNVDYIITRNMGTFCHDKSKLVDFVEEYLKNDHAILKEMRKNQFKHRDPDAAYKIAELI